MNIGKKAIALFVGIAVVAGLSACSGSRGGASKNVSQGIEKRCHHWCLYANKVGGTLE